jgi:ankyrin repeat protein
VVLCSIVLLLPIASVAERFPAVDAGTTPLHWAAEHGLTSIAARLIENGAEIDAPDEFGRTPLHHGVPFPEIVRLLIDSGADVNAVDLFLRTPLHEALQFPESVRILIEAGADIYAEDHLGDTPLDRTLRYGTRRRNLEVIDMLLSAGAGTPRR